jgi:hypothetical protein
MNAEKTQVIWLGTRQQLAKVHIAEIQLLSTSVIHVKLKICIYCFMFLVLIASYV